ncbi:unnamed protein product [Mucor hiemalis]
MSTSEFFESQNDISFENYLKVTPENRSKDSLASVRAILKEYVKEVKKHQQQHNPKFSRLKTTYSDAELKRLIQNTPESGNRTPQSNIYNNYFSDNTIEQLNIVQVS